MFYQNRPFEKDFDSSSSAASISFGSASFVYTNMVSSYNDFRFSLKTCVKLDIFGKVCAVSCAEVVLTN